MTQTNIEYFNSTLILFIKDIIEIYPEYKEILNDYYGDLLNKENNNDDKYIKRFMRKFGSCKTQISNKDNELFDNDCFILKNINFKELWINKNTTSKIKNTLWDYITTLYVIGETIISDSEKIKNLVENFKKIRNNEPIENEENEQNDENKELIDMIKNLSEKKNNKLDEDMINNGLIGSLAKELSEELNMEDLDLNIDENTDNVNDVFTNLMSGDNPMKFMNLIQNVGKKIQNKLENNNIDQDKLVEEAQDMMGMLGNNNPLFDNLLNNAKKGMNAEPPKNESYNNPTRDRLRKKLEMRQKQKK